MTHSFRRLTRPVSFSGVGLHSGAPCSCVIEPSQEGLFLSAGDWPATPLRSLSFEGGGRGSDCVFADGTRVRTCEHVLAALTGLGVWRAVLRAEGPEMPAMDGCSERMAEAIWDASEPCADGPEPFSLPFTVRVGDAERFVAAFPAPSFSLTCVVRYDSPLIGTQMLDFEGGPELFRSEIARARTFALASDIEALRARGMALGGSLDNAILVEEKQVQAKGGLRWPDEFVRHKALDLLGDLALLGRPLNAQVVAVRAGHELHLRLVERLRALTGPRS